MKLRGETVIKWDEAGASVSTASKSVYKKLIKRGYSPTVEDEDHAEFRMAKEDIKLPKPKKQLSEARLAQLAENAKRAREDRG